MLQRRTRSSREKRRGAGRRAFRGSCELLELRALLATAGYDYLITGFVWPNPGHITYSIAPDGVVWNGGGTNILNASFDAKFGNAWQPEIARALATWEAAANINISQVSETGKQDFNAPGQIQGDPRFGDIRIGGDDFEDPIMLAETYPPPPGTGTKSGDVSINTALPFAIGGTYDLYSVLLHETGLSLGLGEPPNPNVVMNTTYGGVRQGLTPGDLAGIVAIYGPRAPDSFQKQGQGISAATAINITPNLNASAQATITSVSLATIGDTEYFRVVAPKGSGSALQVTAAAANVSMLSPQITLLSASGSVLATAAQPSKWSNNVSVSFNQVVPGQQYVIAVTGATNNVFAVGAYQLHVHFPNAVVASPPPNSVPTPPTKPHPPAPVPGPTPITTRPVAPTPTTPAPAPTTAASRYQALWLRYRQALLNRLRLRARPHSAAPAGGVLRTRG
jgi:hypothetical protein